MWLFLGSELLLFAGLFALYAAYRAHVSGRVRARRSHHNSSRSAPINTVVLIISSFTVAWAIHALRRDRRARAVLVARAHASLLGSLFLVLKGVEYSQHFREGICSGHATTRSRELPATARSCSSRSTT